MKFFKNVKLELEKVKWPDKKFMAKYTIATMVFIVFFAMFFFGITALMAFVKGLA